MDEEKINKMFYRTISYIATATAGIIFAIADDKPSVKTIDLNNDGIEEIVTSNGLRKDIFLEQEDGSYIHFKDAQKMFEDSLQNQYKTQKEAYKLQLK